MTKKVLTFGTFDLLHEGHLYFLKKAAKLGELTIIVASDKRVFKLKNKMPVQNQNTRIKNLQKLGFDVKLEAKDPWQNITEEIPNIIVLGYDQNFEKILKLKAQSLKLKAKIIKFKRAYKPSQYKTSLIKNRVKS